MNLERRPDLLDLLSHYSIRDNIFRRLFPYDIQALGCTAKTLVQADEVERYSKLWYDANIGLVAYLDSASTATRISSFSTQPYYCGKYAIAELPRRLSNWLRISIDFQSYSLFYRRLTISASLLRGERVSRNDFILEECSEKISTDPHSTEWRSSTWRIWVDYDKEDLDNREHSRNLMWNTCSEGDYLEIIPIVLKQLDTFIRRIYGQKV